MKQSENPASIFPTLKGKQLLLVEDHALSATITTNLLEAVGALTDWAENGRVAVDMYAASEENHYDAILMDIQMPVMNGIKASKAIRGLPRPDAGQVPIIAMTANAFEEDVRETISAGMDAHLCKPVHVNTLFETLEEVIAEGHLENRQYHAR